LTADLVRRVSSGAAILGVLLLGEQASAARLFFLALLVAAIVGLKLTSGR
jgi:quaternary ammonium compound-resistance protein SugE